MIQDEIKNGSAWIITKLINALDNDENDKETDHRYFKEGIDELFTYLDSKGVVIKRNEDELVEFVNLRPHQSFLEKSDLKTLQIVLTEPLIKENNV